MTPEVRDRIEQLRHGNVPEGYKRTKAGILPADWAVCSIDECLERVERPVNVQADEMYTQIGIRSHGKGLFYKDPVTGKSLGNKAVYWIEPDCFVLNIVFAWEQAIGKTTTSEVGMIGSHRFPMYRPVDGKIDIDYLISYLMTKRGKDILEAASPGGAGRNRTLGQDRFMKSKIVLPALDEQKKIAEILTTQDKVIELKEKLLAEKQRQKKYLMQQLLTGKKRLPGFDDEWAIVSFENVFTFLPTNTLSRDCMSETEGTVFNIHYGDILVRYLEVLDATSIELPRIKPGAEPNNITNIRDGDLIIADTAEDLSVGKAVEIQNAKDKCIASGLHTIFCRPNKGMFAAGWLGYYINSPVFHNQLIPLICGVKVSSISKKEIVKTTIAVPSIREQGAIVNRLSVASREIDLLSQDIEQERQKKKALMQLLLTGIVRV